MADIVKILLQAKIDPEAITNIQNQIKEITKNIKPIKINVDINDEFVKNIENINKVVEATINKTSQPFNIKGNFDKIKINMDAVGKVKKTVTDTTIEYGKQLQVVNKLNKKTGDLETVGKNLMINQEKINKLQSKYWMKRRKETVEDMTKTPDGVKKLNEYYKELEKTTAKVAQEQRKLNKSQSDYWSSVRKEKIEDLTKKPKELEDMSKYYKEQERHMSKMHSQALKENKIYNENQIKIKTLVGTFNELKTEQLEVSDVANILSKKYGNLEVRGKSLDQVTGKYAVTLKKSAKENLILKGSVDKATGALRVQNKTVEQAKNVQLGFFEQMRIALERVPIWLGATTLYFQSFRFLKQVVTDISDINQSMIELEKVSSASREELDSFMQSVPQTSKNLGVVHSDFINLTASISKMGYSLKEAEDIAKTSAIGKIVGDLDNTKDAVDYLVSALKGFGYEIEDINTILDYMNHVANTTSIDFASIGEGYKRMSSAMSEANNTLQESTGLLVAGYDITRNAEITSRALRTVSMRIRGLEEDGSKIEGLIPKLEGQFNDLGLTLKKDDKTFKSTYEIFKDLSIVWGKMSDFKRAKLLEDIASKRNSQVVAAIIKNMDKAIKVSNDFEKSQGSAMLEHEKYMKSVDSTYNKLKETLTKLNMKLLKSQTIIKTLDILTKGLENIEVLGKLSLAFTTVTIAIGIFVIQNRKAIKSMETFNVVSSVGGFKKLISDIGLAIKSLLGFKASADKATVSATALNIATGALLLGVPLLAQGIGYLMNKQKRMNEVNEEVIASFSRNIEKYSNNIKTLKQLEEEYNSLNKKLGENKDFTRLTADEQERYNSLVSQIKQIAPEVVQGYDDKGRAIIAYKTKIEDLIEKEKELIDLENQKMISSGSDIMESTEKEIENLEKKLDPIIKDIKLKQNIIKRKEAMYINSNKLNENSRKAHKQDIIELRAELVELQADYDITTGKIKEQKDQQNKLMKAHYNSLDILDNIPDKLKDITKSYTDATLAEKGYYAAIGQLETFKSIFDSLDKAFHSSSRGEAEHYLSKANDGLSTLNFTVEESDKFVNDYTNSIREVNKETENANKQTSNYEQNLKSLNQQLEENKKLTDDNLNSIQDLGSAYEKLAKGENLSAEALLKLIQKYPEVAKYISQTNDLTLDRGKIIETVAEAEYNAMLTTMDNELTLLYSKQDMLYKTLLAESTYQEISLGMMSGYYASQLEKVKNNPALKEITEQIEVQKAAIIAMRKEGFDNIFNPTESSSKVGSSKTKFISDLETRYREFNSVLDKLNKALDINNEKMNQTKSDADKISLLKEKIELLTQLQYKKQELTDEQEKERNEIVSSINEIGKSYGITADIINGVAKVEGLGKINNITGKTIEDTNKLREEMVSLVEKLDKSNESVRQGELEWWKYRTTILGLRDELDGLGKTLYENFQQKYKDKLKAVSEVENKIIEMIKKRGEIERDEIEKTYQEDSEYLEKRHNKKMDSLKEELERFKKNIDEQLSALDKQYAEEDYLKNLQKEREKANEIQKKINELSLDDSLDAKNRVIELREELANQNEKIAEMQQNRERDILKKNLQDQSKAKEKAIKKEEDRENRSYERRKQKLDKNYRENKEELDKKYSDYSIYIEAREVLESGYIEDYEGNMVRLKDAYEDFEDRFGIGMSYLGDQVQDEFIDKIEDAIDVIEKLNNMGIKSSKNNKGNKLNMNDEDYAIYLHNKKNWEDGTVTESQKATNEYLRKKYNIDEDKYSYQDLVGSYKKGGIIPKTGIAKVHEDEIMLSDKHIKGTWDIFEKIKDGTFMSRYLTPKITTPQISSVGGYGDINLYFNVKGNLDKKVLPDIEKTVRKVVREKQIQKNRNLNKIGVFRGVR